MPRRIKDNNKSIFVKFFDDATTKEIHSLFDSLNVKGMRVSTLLNRWAVEVPFWKEDFYEDKFTQSEIVEKVHENLNRRRASRQDGDENDGE